MLCFTEKKKKRTKKKFQQEDKNIIKYSKIK